MLNSSFDFKKGVRCPAEQVNACSMVISSIALSHFFLFNKTFFFFSPTLSCTSFSFYNCSSVDLLRVLISSRYGSVANVIALFASRYSFRQKQSTTKKWVSPQTGLSWNLDLTTCTGRYSRKQEGLCVVQPTSGSDLCRDFSLTAGPDSRVA